MPLLSPLAFQVVSGRPTQWNESPSDLAGQNPIESEAGLRSVGRAATVLQAFLQRPEWGLADLTREVGLPKSVVHRLLATLSAAGLVDESEHVYRIGPLIPRLAELNRSRVDLVALAQPLLRELRDLTGETVTLCEIRKLRGFCLDFAESPQSMRMTVYRGETFPLNAGAIGKALLAFQDEEFVAAVLQDAELSAYTPRTIVDPQRLRRDLARVRRQGFAESEGEITPGARSVGVPVRSPADKVIASLAVSAPTFRLGIRRGREVATALMDAADRLAATLRSGQRHHENSATQTRRLIDAI
jgi:DNA-binding IclR family transcriptional regulator